MQEQFSIESDANNIPIEKERNFNSETLDNNINLENEAPRPIIVPEAITSSFADENTLENNFMASEDVDDTEELPGDSYYISEEKKIIQKDSKKPFNENMDLSELEKKYLKNRFDVSIALDKEKR